jgi:hypothetical protein
MTQHEAYTDQQSHIHLDLEQCQVQKWWVWQFIKPIYTWAA